MKNSTFAAAALAAGLTLFASHAQSQPAAAEAAKPASEGPQTLMELFSAKKEGDTAEKSEVDDTKTGSIEKTDEGKPFGAIIAKHAAAHDVPIELAHAVISIESSYRADARGQAGEVGLMQIKPATARMMGYSGSTKDLYNPDTNILYGMKYLAKARELGGGDTCGTILRYNAGHGAKRMNPISAAYCAKVKQRLGE